jgi:hypothetical protein
MWPMGRKTLVALQLLATLDFSQRPRPPFVLTPR